MPSNKKTNITDEQFDAALFQLVKEMSAAELWAIPGMYELLSEELNNEAIERAERDLENEAVIKSLDDDD